MVLKMWFVFLMILLSSWMTALGGFREQKVPDSSSRSSLSLSATPR